MHLDLCESGIPSRSIHPYRSPRQNAFPGSSGDLGLYVLSDSTPFQAVPRDLRDPWLLNVALKFDSAEVWTSPAYSTRIARIARSKIPSRKNERRTWILQRPARQGLYPSFKVVEMTLKAAQESTGVICGYNKL